MVVEEVVKVVQLAMEELVVFVLKRQ